MANKTWAGSNGDAWETASGGVWSPVGDPGVNDKVIISSFSTNKPLGPVGAATVHDVEILNVAANTAGNWSNLTVSGTITLSATTNHQVTLTIASQTTAGQAISLTWATLTATTIAGNVTLDANSQLVNATINGSADASAGTANAFSNVTINGALTVGGGDPISPDRNIAAFGGSASIHFVGSTPGSIFSAVFGGVLVADGDLLIIAADNSIDLTGATITVGGNIVVLSNFLQGQTVTMPTSIAGPALATKYAVLSGVSATPTGFGPAYKIGSGGATTVGAYQSTVTLPAQGTVTQGTNYGPDDGLTGTATGAGGRINAGMVS